MRLIANLFLLARQYPEYLALQLPLFKKGIRGGTPYAHIMSAVASRLTSGIMGR